MRFQTLSAIFLASAVSAQSYPASAAPTSSPPALSPCAAACEAAFSKCKAQPNENNSFCVSEYAGCLGYNPFAAGAPSPTACITTAAPTYASTPAPYPTAGGDKCAADCTAAFDKCKAQPNENNSFCVSQYAGCLGYNPFAEGAPSPTACITTAAPTYTAAPAPDKCAADCTAAFDKCKAQPNENNSYCVSQYAGCLGYNPFAAAAPSPTACRTTAAPTYPASSAPAPYPTAGGDKCAANCAAAFTDCKAQPNENNSYCVSQYAGCLGYNPFAEGAPSPTACVSSTVTAAPAPAPTGTGGVPVGTPKPSVVPFKGGAGATKPVMGLLGLGLLALL